MRYGCPTVRWISLALGFLCFFTSAFLPQRATAQNILPGFNKPGVLVSDTMIPSDSGLRLDEPIWSGPCIDVTDVGKFAHRTLLLSSGVLVSDGPLVVDCVIVVESYSVSHMLFVSSDVNQRQVY